MMEILTAPVDDCLLIAAEMERHGTVTVVAEYTRVLSTGDTRVLSTGDTRITWASVQIETYLLIAPVDDDLLTA